eukprot:273470-Rhodomonas_salina.2
MTCSLPSSSRSHSREPQPTVTLPPEFHTHPSSLIGFHALAAVAAKRRSRAEYRTWWDEIQ